MTRAIAATSWRLTLGIAAVSACVLASGCGAASPQKGVRDAVGAYFASLADADWPSACARLTANARRELFALAVKDAPEQTLSVIRGDGTSDDECATILQRAFKDAPVTTVQQLRFVKVAQVSLDGGRAYARLVGIDVPSLTRFGATQIPVLVKKDGAWEIDSLGVDLLGGATATISRGRSLVEQRAAQKRSAAELARVHGVATDLGQAFDYLLAHGKTKEQAATWVNAQVVKEVARTRDAQARYSLAEGTLTWERGILGASSTVCVSLARQLHALDPDVS